MPADNDAMRDSTGGRRCALLLVFTVERGRGQSRWLIIGGRGSAKVTARPSF